MTINEALHELSKIINKRGIERISLRPAAFAMCLRELKKKNEIAAFVITNAAEKDPNIIITAEIFANNVS